MATGSGDVVRSQQRIEATRVRKHLAVVEVACAVVAQSSGSEVKAGRWLRVVLRPAT